MRMFTSKTPLTSFFLSISQWLFNIWVKMNHLQGGHKVTIQEKLLCLPLFKLIHAPSRAANSSKLKRVSLTAKRGHGLVLWFKEVTAREKMEKVEAEKGDSTWNWSYSDAVMSTVSHSSCSLCVTAAPSPNRSTAFPVRLVFPGTKWSTLILCPISESRGQLRPELQRPGSHASSRRPRR